MTRAAQEVGKRRKTAGARPRAGVALGDITNVASQGLQQDDAKKQAKMSEAPVAEQKCVCGVDVAVCGGCGIMADSESQAQMPFVPEDLAKAPSFFRSWDQGMRDRAMAFFAQAASHYGVLGQPAQLDVKQEFGLTDCQVLELCKYFGTSPSDVQVTTAAEEALPAQNHMEDSELLGTASSEASSDPQAVPEYATKIFSRMRGNEMVDAPRHDYMHVQRDINSRMRSILVDWLVDVHLKYKLRTETLFMGVALTDRFLAKRPTSRGELQLVGAVSMLVAAKFEEIHPPEVADFRYITANAYSVEEIMQMECKLLNTLDFQLAFPTVAHFLIHFTELSQSSVLRREMAQYLAELSLLDIRVLRFPPSLIAAAALLLSGDLLGERPAWPPQLAQEAQYEESAVRDCAAWLGGLVSAAPTAAEQAVRRKFAKPCHSCVADMVKGS